MKQTSFLRKTLEFIGIVLLVWYCFDNTVTGQKIVTNFKYLKNEEPETFKALFVDAPKELVHEFGQMHKDALITNNHTFDGIREAVREIDEDRIKKQSQKDGTYTYADVKEDLPTPKSVTASAETYPQELELEDLNAPDLYSY